MSARRPYSVSLRSVLRRGGIAASRASSFATRDAAFARARELAQTPVYNVAVTVRHEAIVFGPDRDLWTGRLVYPDGTEADLMEIVAASIAENEQRIQRLLGVSR